MGRPRPPFVRQVQRERPDKRVEAWFQDEAVSDSKAD
jgi:hypothetical protein